MKKGIALNVYKNLTESLKMRNNKVYQGINDVFNSKLECVCFIDEDSTSRLINKGLVEFKKTKFGNCCVLTSDNNLKEVLRYSINVLK